MGIMIIINSWLSNSPLKNPQKKFNDKRGGDHLSFINYKLIGVNLTWYGKTDSHWQPTFTSHFK